MSIGNKVKWKIQTLRLTEEDIERLDEIAKKKYRTPSRAQAVRLMIEDVWKEVSPIERGI